jgi:hypothetical protein
MSMSPEEFETALLQGRRNQLFGPNSAGIIQDDIGRWSAAANAERAREAARSAAPSRAGKGSSIFGFLMMVGIIGFIVLLILSKAHS